MMGRAAAIVAKSAAAPIERASNFAFKGYFKTRLGCSKEKDDYLKWLA
uniref:Uncharacterized protein n=1 Tax=Brassica oleracea var. oleracea TaxID=109376 RepID=A0A0D3CBM9_BRAOL